MGSNKENNKTTTVMKNISSSIRVLLVALCSLATIDVQGGTLAANSAARGDLNGDGQLSVSDLTLLVDRILTGDSTMNFEFRIADLNNDGQLTVSDVTLLVEMILNGTIEEPEVTTPVEGGKTPPGGWGPSQAGQNNLWE